jgi:hypothetical protein
MNSHQWLNVHISDVLSIKSPYFVPKSPYFVPKSPYFVPKLPYFVPKLPYFDQNCPILSKKWIFWSHSRPLASQQGNGPFMHHPSCVILTKFCVTTQAVKRSTLTRRVVRQTGKSNSSKFVFHPPFRIFQKHIFEQKWRTHIFNYISINEENIVTVPSKSKRGSWWPDKFVKKNCGKM